MNTGRLLGSPRGAALWPAAGLDGIQHIFARMEMSWPHAAYSLWVYDQDTRAFRAVATGGHHPVFPESLDDRPDLQDEVIFAHGVIDLPIADSLGRRTYAAPLRGPGDLATAGFLALTVGDEASLDRDMLAQLAQQVAHLLETKVVLMGSERRRQRVEVCAEAARELAQTTDPGQAGALIAATLQTLLEADGAVVYTVEHSMCRRLATAGLGELFARVEEAVPCDIGLPGLAVRERRVVVTRDWLGDPAIIVRPVERVALSDADVTVGIGIPLVTSDEVLGVVVCLKRRGGHFAPEDIEVAELFGHHAALALASAVRSHAFTQRQYETAELATVATLLTGSPDLEHVAARIVESAKRLLNAPEATLRVRQPDGSYRLLWPPAPPVWIPAVVHAGTALVAVMLEQQKPVWVANILEETSLAYPPGYRERYEAAAAEAGLVARLLVPVRLQAEILGYLSVFDRPRTFSEDDLRLAGILADHAAVALRIATLYRTNEARREAAEVLAQIGRTVAQALDPHEIAQHLVDAFRHLLRTRSAALFGYEAETSMLTTLAVTGDVGPELEHGVRLSISTGGTIAHALAARAAVRTADVIYDPDIPLTAEGRRKAAASAYRAALVVPLMVRDRVIGALSTRDVTGRVFTEDDALLAERFADHAAVALDNAQTHAREQQYRLRLQALLDIEEAFAQELDLARLHLLTVDPRVTALFDAAAAFYVIEGERMRLVAYHDDTASLPPLEDVLPLAALPATDIVSLAEYEHHPEAHPDLVAVGLQRVLAARLTFNGVPLGTCVLGRRTDAASFSLGDEDLFRQFITYAAIALDKAHQYARAERRRAEAEQLRDMTRLLTETLDLDRLARHIVDAVANTFRPTVVAVRMLEGEDTLRLLAQVAPRSVTLPPTVLVGARVSGLIASRRAVVHIADVSSDHVAITEEARDILRDLGGRAVLGVPLEAHGQLVGTLAIADRAPRVFSDDEVALFRAFGAHAALALANARLYSAEQARRREVETLAAQHQALARHAETKLTETNTLLEVSRAVSSSLELKVLLRQFLRRVSAVLGADSVGTYLLRGEWLVPLQGYRLPPERVDVLRTLQLSAVSHPFYAEGARTKRAIVSADITHDPRIPEEIREAYPHTSQLFTPILARGELIGGLVACWVARAREFSPDELALVEAIANQAGVAIENARLYQENQRRLSEVERQADRLATLMRLTHLVASSLETRDVVAELVNVCVALFGVRLVAAWRVDAASSTVAMTAMSGEWSPWALTQSGSRFGESIVRLAAEERREISVPDVKADPRWRDMQWAELRSVVAWPVVEGGDVVCVLVLVHDAPVALTPEDGALLDHLVRHASIALRHARLFSEKESFAQRLQRVDAITQRLAATPQAVEVPALVTEALVEFCASPFATVWVLDQERSVVRRWHTAIPGDVLSELPDTLDLETVVGQIALSRTPMMSQDMVGDPAKFPCIGPLLERGFRYFSGYPLMVGELVFGVFTVATREVLHRSAEDDAVFRSLAAHAGLALANAELLDASERRGRLFERLTTLTRQWADFDAPAAIRARLAHSLSQLLPGSLCNVWSYRGEQWRLLGTHGFDALRDVPEDAPTLGSDLPPTFWGTGGPLVWPQIAAVMVEPGWLAHAGIITGIAVPFMLGPDDPGLACIYVPDHRLVGTPELDALATFAEAATSALARAAANAEAEAHRQEIGAVSRTLQAMLERRTVRERAQAFIEGTKGLVDFDRVAVLMATADESALVIEAATPAEMVSLPPLPLEDEGLLYPQVWIGGREVVVREDLGPDRMPLLSERVRQHPLARSTRFAVFPVRVTNKTLGVVAADNKLTQRPLSEQSITRLRSFVQQLATALGNARLLEITETQERRARTLFEATRRLAAAVSLEEIPGILTESIQALLSVPKASLGYWRRGEPVDEATTSAPAAAEMAILNRVVTTRCVVPIVDRFKDATVEMSPEFRARLLAIGAHPAVLAAPILAGNVLYGVLLASQPTPRVWTKGEREAIEALAVQAAGAIERLRTSQAERLAREAAEAATQVKSQFLATVSHEMRTPLNAVIAMSRFLRDTALTADQAEYVDAVCRSGEDLLTLINQVLDFSRIEAGKLTLDTCPFEVRQVLEDAVEAFAEVAHRKGLELVTSIDPSVPEWLTGDPSRIRQVVANLVSNALKFTDAGEVLIEVRCVPVAAEHLELWVEVHDTGIGISDEASAKLFQAFSQVDSSPTRRYGGTGLGLAISKHLIDLMGGTIRMQSEVGRGSRFWFSIPLKPAAQPDRSAVAVPPGTRALVVDDRESTRRTLRHYLISLGASVDEASNGGDGSALLAQTASLGRPYDLAVLDETMPGLDGLDLATSLRSKGTRTRVILLIPWGDKRAREAALAVADSVVTKPVRYSELARAAATTELEPQLQLPTIPTVVTRRPMPVAEPPGGWRGHLLVAEDHPTNQQVAATMFAKLGYRTDIVANGAEALEAVERVTYDAVVLDLAMPVMDGLTAARELRKREATRRVPLIAMTAAVTPADRKNCVEVGIDAFIPKPVPEDQLRTVLARLLPAAAAPAPARKPSAAAQLEGFDPAALETLTEILRAGGPGTIVNLIETLLEEARAKFAQAEEAIARGDVAAVRAAGHDLIQTVGPFGPVVLVALVRSLQERARANDVQQLPTILTRIREEFEQVVPQLRSLEQFLGRLKHRAKSRQRADRPTAATRARTGSHTSRSEARGPAKHRRR